MPVPIVDFHMLPDLRNQKRVCPLQSRRYFRHMILAKMRGGISLISSAFPTLATPSIWPFSKNENKMNSSLRRRSLPLKKKSFCLSLLVPCTNPQRWGSRNLHACGEALAFYLQMTYVTDEKKGNRVKSNLEFLTPPPPRIFSPHPPTSTLSQLLWPQLCPSLVPGLPSCPQISPSLPLSALQPQFRKREHHLTSLSPPSNTVGWCPSWDGSHSWGVPWYKIWPVQEGGTEAWPVPALWPPW